MEPGNVSSCAVRERGLSKRRCFDGASAGRGGLSEKRVLRSQLYGMGTAFSDFT